MGVELTEIKKIWFKKIREKKELLIKNRLILDFCKEKEVLDVGCVGQDIDYSNPNWIHSQVKEIAEELAGVDINIDGIKELNSMGYNISHYNELNYSKKFDVILMLDVIEHVDNPVEFIKNYQQFLKEDGKMVITTPNSNRAINFINILFKNEYSLNYEHTFWFCPKTFMEVIERVDTLTISDFYWLNHYSKAKTLNWKNKIVYGLDGFLIKLRSNFAPNFMFVLELKK
jgi:2-polyprenyl-3-methyl-5-hydroxy-6-metoxy-1,4-benzoquinol methylase